MACSSGPRSMTTITSPSSCARPLPRHSATRRRAARGKMMSRLLAAIFLLLTAIPAYAEDGYDLWLRYRPMEASALAQYRPLATVIVSEKASPSLDAAKSELIRGLSGLLDRPVGAGTLADGAVVIGTPVSSALIAGLKLPLTNLGKEGYLIRGVSLNGHAVTVIAANSDIGV